MVDLNICNDLILKKYGEKVVFFRLLYNKIIFSMSSHTKDDKNGTLLITHALACGKH